MIKFRRLTICLSILALCLITTTASADGTKKDRLIYSLDTGMGITGDRGNVGTPLQQDYDVAIRINDKKFVGMTIAAVRVPMGEVENISNLKVWLSKELKLETVNGKKTNVPDVLSQDVAMAKGWIEVPLEHPYTITDEGIYVGYSFKMDKLDDTNKRPVRITTELHEGGLFLHTSRSYRSWTDVSDQCSSLLQVELDGAPMYAASVLPGTTTYFGATGRENSVTFYVENHGATGVKSIEYAYTYDGKNLTGSYKLPTALSSIYGVTTSFDVKLPSVENKNYYPLDITITKVNDNDNEDEEKQTSSQICIFDKLPKHRAVLEEYTGTWCGYCPRGYVGLAAMNRLHPEDFIALSYHNSESADNPDPMEVMPGEYFPSVITSFPGAWVDRAYEVDAYGGFWASSKDLGIETVWQAVCDMLAEADINVDATISDDNSIVTATATLNFPLKIDNAKYGVEYVLVADGLTGTGQGWDQRNYYANGKQGKDFSEPEFKQFVEGDSYVSGLKFDDVAIATTRLTGDNQYLPESIEQDNDYKLTATFNLNKVRNTQNQPIIQDIKKLRVVAMLIDYNDGTVVNAAKTGYFADPAGISNVNTNGNFEIKAIYDISGRKLDAMQKGLNIVKTVDGKITKIFMK